MSELAQKRCKACGGETEALSGEDAARMLKELPNWTISQQGRLAREFRFIDFASALDATNLVGDLAEEEGHHPDLHLSWGRLGVEVWTHKVNGLTESDFILAAKIEERLGLHVA